MLCIDLQNSPKEMVAVAGVVLPVGRLLGEYPANSQVGMDHVFMITVDMLILLSVCLCVCSTTSPVQLCY